MLNGQNQRQLLEVQIDFNALVQEAKWGMVCALKSDYINKPYTARISFLRTLDLDVEYFCDMPITDETVHGIIMVQELVKYSSLIFFLWEKIGPDDAN